MVGDRDRTAAGRASPAVLLRPAEPGDREALLPLLWHAFDWRGEGRLTVQQVRDDPTTSRYLDGWVRPGDVGTVAVDATDRPVGGAWGRLLSGRQAGYGYVADGVPELTVAVLPGSRGRGVGRAVLDAVVAQARLVPVRALSLGVEDGNTVARALYADVGFRPVGRVDDAGTMLLVL